MERPSSQPPTSAPGLARLRIPVETHPLRASTNLRRKRKRRRRNSATPPHAGLTTQPRCGRHMYGNVVSKKQQESNGDRSGSDKRVTERAAAPPCSISADMEPEERAGRAQKMTGGFSWSVPHHPQSAGLSRERPRVQGRRGSGTTRPDSGRGHGHTISEMLTPHLGGSGGHLLVCGDLSPGGFPSPSPTREPRGLSRGELGTPPL